MSRVERTETSTERRGSEQLRQAQRGRKQPASSPTSNPGRTPSKAEGELADVEEALKHQQE